MIKRIIATLTICLIITGLISPVFSNASAVPQPNWTDPGISEIINISDLTGWMLNGGTFDVSTYTDSESFMNDYFYGRTSTRLVDGNDLYYSQFGIGQDLYNIGSQSYNSKLDTVRLISSSFREHSGYGRRFSEQANKTLLDSGNLYDMKIPLLNEVEFANFVGYNHDALKLYQQIFNEAAPDDPTPNPDPDFSFINNINNLYLPGGNLMSFNGLFNYSNTHPTLLKSLNSVTLTANGFVSHKNHLPEADGGVTVYALNPICTISVYTSENGVDVTYSEQISDFLFYNISSKAYQTNFIYINTNNNECYMSLAMGNNPSTPRYQQSHFDGISQCINYIYDHYCNINLYVDGVLWALANSPSVTPTITPEFPDAVGGEDLPSTTWPIYRPRAPYYTSVPGMLQAIDDAIQGDGKLDIDDLKPYLIDENGDPVPDPVFDPEPVPIPVPDPVNPDVVPQLPELPSMPLDMPGFNGVSVLAEIINFTNQSLPNALIVTFWGIVFGIVILGLIKILHK